MIAFVSCEVREAEGLLGRGTLVSLPCDQQIWPWWVYLELHYPLSFHRTEVTHVASIAALIHSLANPYSAQFYPFCSPAALKSLPASLGIHTTCWSLLHPFSTEAQYQLMVASPPAMSLSYLLLPWSILWHLMMPNINGGAGTPSLGSTGLGHVKSKSVVRILAEKAVLIPTYHLPVTLIPGPTHLLSLYAYSSFTTGGLLALAGAVASDARDTQNGHLWSTALYICTVHQQPFYDIRILFNL